MFIQVTTIQSYNIKTLSLYMMLKLRYKNSTMYKWSYEKVSNITGLSLYMSKKLVDSMIDSKLAYKSGKNLSLVSFRKIGTREKNVIKETFIKYDDKLKDVILKLRYVLFRYYIQDRQNYVIKGKADRELSKVKKLMKLNVNLEKPPFDGICFGYRKLSKILGISLMSIKNFLNDLKRFGFIKDFELRLIESNVNKSMIISAWKKKIELPYRYVWKDDKVYLHLGTTCLI